jgi:GTP-binding protein
VASVHREPDFPKPGPPVVALLGRSNVGKSSLLNRLLGRPAARVAKKPGKTRGIYFYETADGHRLADLPGTGFARVSREERERWSALADRFFRTQNVVLAMRLIDPRVPEAPADAAMRDYVEALGVPSVAVATKWDRVSAGERPRAKKALEMRYGEVLPVSAKTGEGIEALRRLMQQRTKEEKGNSHG